jgi:hypothetical protein
VGKVSTVRQYKPFPQRFLPRNTTKRLFLVSYKRCLYAFLALEYHFWIYFLLAQHTVCKPLKYVSEREYLVYTRMPVPLA